MRRRRKDDNAAQVKRRSTAKSKHFRYLERILACGSLGSCGAGRLARASRAKLGRLRGIQRARALDSKTAARICSTAQPTSSAVRRPPSPPNEGHAQTRSHCRAQPQKIRANSGNRVDSTPRGSGVEDSSLASLFRQPPLAEFFRHPLPLIGHEEGKSTARFARDFSEVCKIDQSLKPLIGIVFFLKLRTLLCEKP
jgi:hypothetical protein